MATLYITEFPNGALIGGTAIHTTAIIAEQSLGIEDASVASKPFSLRTDLIMVEADYPCCLAFGKDPKADPGKHRIGADRPRIYGVMPGDRIAVIAAQ